MTIDFTNGDILIPNVAYVTKTLSNLTTTTTLKQALETLGGLRCVPSTVTTVGNISFPVRSFIRLVPVDTSHRFYKLGTGVIVYFDTDTQLNNSFEVSGAYLKDKCFIKALNSSGISITKGQLVRQTGFDTSIQLATIALADATTATNTVVLGVAMEDLANGEMGSILIDGSYQTDTSSFSISSQVFVSDTPGAISTTAGTVAVVCGRVLLVGLEGTISLFSTLTGGGGTETFTKPVHDASDHTGLPGIPVPESTIDVSIVWRGDLDGNISPVVTPLFPFLAPTKLSDPAILPPFDGQGVAWSPSGEYVSVAHTSSPFVTIYRRDGKTFTKLANPATLPPDNAQGVAWSPNSEFMVVGHSTSPFITIYQRNGLTFTKQPNPGTIPAGLTFDLGWSSNSEFLACPHQSSPFITVYQRDGTTFTKLADPATLPASTARYARWSPNGEFLAVGHFSSPFFTTYQRQGSTLTKIADPATLPTGAVFSLDWSPNGKYLAVGDGASPFLRIYELTGTTLAQIALPDVNPVKGASSIHWHPSGKFVALGVSDISPFIQIYAWDGTSLTKQPDVAVPPSGSAFGNAWSPTGEFLGVAHRLSPFFSIYQTTGVMPDDGNLRLNFGVKLS